MIEQLSNYLAHKLINQYDDSSDSPDIEVIQYGIECIINTAVPLVLIFTYSIYCDSVFEMVTWVITFLLLRNYLGGYHAPSHISCMILSSFYGIFSIYIIDTIQNLPLRDMLLTGCIYFILNIFAGPIIYDNDLKDKKRKFLTGTIVILLLLFFLLSVLYSFVPKIACSIFIGICSAEILYVIALVAKLWK